MSDKYILNGHTPVKANLMEWARWYETARDERVVAKSDVGTDTTVSTVFLGLGHSFGMGGPLLFETMIFGGSYNENLWRYATWDEALAGHERVVKALRDGVEP